MESSISNNIQRDTISVSLMFRSISFNLYVLSKKKLPKINFEMTGIAERKIIEIVSRSTFIKTFDLCAFNGGH